MHSETNINHVRLNKQFVQLCLQKINMNYTIYTREGKPAVLRLCATYEIIKCGLQRPCRKSN